MSFMVKLLFHGTIYNFSVPDLSKCRDRKDFGRGFYLAEDINQSRAIANKAYIYGGSGVQKFIYSYSIDISKMRKLEFNIHEFREANVAWLDYIISNRMLLSQDDYDIVIGPTADANTQIEVAKFYDKYGMTADIRIKQMFIQKIKPSVYGRQYCFKTQRAVDYLNDNFVERRCI